MSFKSVRATPLLATLLLGPLLTSLGCTCSKEEPVAKKAEPAAPAKPVLPPRVDETLLGELRAAALDCKDTGRHMTCGGGKKNALTLAFNRGDRSRAQALPTFAYALSLGETPLAALSASVLYASFRTGLGTGKDDPAKDSVKPEDALLLLEGALKLAPQPAMQATPAAVHAMLLTGQGDTLQQKLTGEQPIQVRTMALRYMLTYGRLVAFPTLELASREPATAVVLAAVESPRNMAHWSDAERAQLCPWLRTFLSDERKAVAGNAVAGLTHCAGEHIDALLTGIEKSITSKQFSFIHSTALRELCGKARADGESQATESQCGKVRTLQERAASSKDLEPRVRAMTLSNLAYDFPDAASLKLAKKLEKDPSEELKRSAGQIVKRLERQVAQ